jgi:hypothetical protein
MSLFPEKEPKPIKGLEIRPEEVSPLEIEKKEVVQPIPSQFKGQVANDQGQPLIQTPQSQVVTITLPKDPEVLEIEAKGEIDETSTWSASWWLRLIKKAYLFGWKIVTGIVSGKESKL